MDVLELSDRLWNGEITTEDHHPFAPTGELVDVADGVAFLSSFANVTAVRTDVSLVLVDTGSPQTATHVHETVRRWTDRRLEFAVFSHGHIDHVFGVGPFEEEQGAGTVEVVAHEAMTARFDRYVLTNGWNAAINKRQFSIDELEWPTQYRYPDTTYRHEHIIEPGGERIELRHARGETDDHTWTWIPGRRVLCPGDLFIWSFPNAGNPQKVQRYPREWAGALHEMAALGAEVLLPGHGVPIVGEERIRQALTDTATALESVHDQTVEMMNAGADLDEIIHSVRVPDELTERPYLRPVYDEPEFVVRNIWRLYGGWWDGNPAHLKPAPVSALAAEIARLAGGAGSLADRAEELAAQGDLRLAGHLVEFAYRGDPENEAVRRAYTQVNEARAQAEASTMARGVFATAAREVLRP